MKEVCKKIMQVGFSLFEGTGIGRAPGVDRLFHLISSITGEIEYEIDGLKIKSLMYYYPKRHLLYYGKSYEPEIRSLFCSLINKGGTVVDIGASLGLYTLIAAKKLGNSGFVYSFEPDPIRYAKLMENIRINRLNNIKAFNVALSDREEDIEIIYHHPRDGFKKCIVKAQPLDSLNIKPDLIKMDVDGAEIKILEGMKKTMTYCRPKIICEIHPDEIAQMGYNTDDLSSLLNKVGYLAYEIKSDLNLSLCQTLGKSGHSRYLLISENDADNLKIKGWHIDS